MKQQFKNKYSANKTTSVAQLQQKAAYLTDNRPVQKKPNNTGLPDNLKSGIENLSGYDMSDVRVHYNSAQPQQLQAHAFAQGSNIHIAPGQEKHLPHEAWHVVQQKQGRVKPTLQMKGKYNVNDDKGLEHEADVMGNKALQPLQLLSHQNTNSAHLQNNDAQTIQAKFVKLSEEKIIEIQKAAKEEKGEDLEAEYLQGLYISDTNTGNNPELYIKVTTIPRYYVTGNPDDIHKLNGVPIFTRVETLTDAQKREEEMKTDTSLPESAKLNDMQIIYQDAKFYSENETEFDLKTIHGRASRYGKTIADSAVNRIVGDVLTGGVSEDSSSGGYGSIEFRFKKPEGVLFLLNTLKPDIIKTRFPELEIKLMNEMQIKALISLYRHLHLPYADTRNSSDYLFIEKSYLEAYKTAVEYADKHGRLPDVFMVPNSVKQQTQTVLPAAPINVPKTRKKEYTFSATRGSRDAGQKAAMGGFSAYDYVNNYSPHEANAASWEWLHIQGSRLGGPNRPENLVAGTADANTHMIPYERIIFELSRASNSHYPVDVLWQATVRKDTQHNNTQIGDEIHIDINYPKGAPPATSQVDPEKVKHLFPVTFKASHNAPFTKLDRDLIDGKKK